jgi:hypothetical protein
MEKHINRDKIIKTLCLNHDGVITEIRHENNQLNMKIEISYLANMINEDYTIMKYKLLGYSKLEFINCEENNKKYTNIDEIEKMELTILDAKKIKKGICINVVTSNDKYGIIFLLADDIIIYDQNNIEMDYNELYEICKNYWNNLSKNGNT